MSIVLPALQRDVGLCVPVPCDLGFLQCDSVPRPSGSRKPSYESALEVRGCLSPFLLAKSSAQTQGCKCGGVGHGDQRES